MHNLFKDGWSSLFVLIPKSTQATHISIQPLRRPDDIPLRSGSTTATAESTTEAGSELARGGTLLVTLLAAAVATLTRSTGTALTLLTTHHAARGSVGTLLLDVGGRDNLSGEVEPLTEVVKTLKVENLENRSSFLILAIGWSQTYLGGEGVVVVLPGELGLDIATGVEGLQSLDHVEVLGVNVAVLGKVEVLLGHEHTLCTSKSATVVFQESEVNW
jgi:hypothetical protein